jgi:hypothetical protein
MEKQSIFYAVGPDVLNVIYMHLKLQPHVEAGSNTSTVDLPVVGDDEKGTQCLRV